MDHIIHEQILCLSAYLHFTMEYWHLCKKIIQVNSKVQAWRFFGPDSWPVTVPMNLNAGMAPHLITLLCPLCQQQHFFYTLTTGYKQRNNYQSICIDHAPGDLLKANLREDKYTQLQRLSATNGQDMVLWSVASETVCMPVCVTVYTIKGKQLEVTTQKLKSRHALTLSSRRFGSELGVSMCLHVHMTAVHIFLVVGCWHGYLSGEIIL